MVMRLLLGESYSLGSGLYAGKSPESTCCDRRLGTRWYSEKRNDSTSGGFESGDRSYLL